MLRHNVRAVSEFYTHTAKMHRKCPVVRLLSRALQSLQPVLMQVINKELLEVEVCPGFNNAIMETQKCTICSMYGICSSGVKGCRRLSNNGLWEKLIMISSHKN